MRRLKTQTQPSTAQAEHTRRSVPCCPLRDMRHDRMHEQFVVPDDIGAFNLQHLQRIGNDKPGEREITGDPH